MNVENYSSGPVARAISKVIAKDYLARISSVKCVQCASAFQPRRKEYSTYCSRECSFAAKAAAPSCSVWFGQCIGCEAPFTSQRKRIYCSVKCQSRSQYTSVAPTTKICRCCGDEFSPPKGKGRPSEYCGAACASYALDETRSVIKAKRRALTCGAAIDRLDPFVVFNRDKWVCQLCKGKTPRSKRGTYDDDAPELDHIITLSEGGEHSYRNTQCACRKCNGLKSGRSMGQLLIFG